MPDVGLVNGTLLEARGDLLQLDGSPEDLGDEQAQRASVQLPSIRDWVIDHSPQPAVWLVTDVAWYRCTHAQTCRGGLEAGH